MAFNDVLDDFVFELTCVAEVDIPGSVYNRENPDVVFGLELWRWLALRLIEKRTRTYSHSHRH